MTTSPQSAAKTITDQIFDRIERDRTLIRQAIEEIVCDGLILHAAKSALPSEHQNLPAERQLEPTAWGVITMLERDSGLHTKMPYHLLAALGNMNSALMSLPGGEKRRWAYNGAGLLERVAS